jgi:hypothetical protein
MKSVFFLKKFTSFSGAANPSPAGFWDGIELFMFYFLAFFMLLSPWCLVGKTRHLPRVLA